MATRAGDTCCARCLALARRGPAEEHFFWWRVIGGDEFTVVAPGAGVHGARRLAAALAHAASQVFDPGGSRWRGTAAWASSGDGDDAEAWCAWPTGACTARSGATTRREPARSRR